MTPEALANKIEDSLVSIAGYESGFNFPSPDVIDQLCRFFCVSRNYLLGQTDDRNASSAVEGHDDVQIYGGTECPIIKKKAPPDLSEDALKIVENYEKLSEKWKSVVRFMIDEAISHTKKTSVRYVVPALQIDPEMPQATVYYMTSRFHQPMSAGFGTEAGDDSAEDFMLVKQPPRGTSYVAPISGDSMEPTFHDGDKLFIQACTNIELGQIGVFFMDGKQWVKELGDGVLISHNPKYPPIPMTEDIRCQGLVLGICDDSYFA